MKRYAAVFLFLIVAAHAQATPEEAIVKLVTAETAGDLMSVLPEKTRTALAKASPQTRAKLFSHFMQVKKDELNVEARASDDLLTLRDKSGTVQHIKVKQWVNDGMNAVLALDIDIENKGVIVIQEPMLPIAVVAWTRMEEGNWRIVGIAAGSMLEFDSDELLVAIKNDLQTPPQASEASAVGSLRTLNTANVTYASTDDTGFAPSLQALASGGAKDPSPEHSMLIDDVLASGEKDGYVFTYERHGTQAYTITARPKQFGVSGKRNFFTDESGVIRFTEEDRPATVHDAPLN